MFNHQLTAFVAVADCVSFIKAADILFITPTALMKQINTLEVHLNLKLIERTKHGVHLTPEQQASFSRWSSLTDKQKQLLLDLMNTKKERDFVSKSAFFLWRREGDLNPRAGTTDLLVFEARPFSHLGTSPCI